MLGEVKYMPIHDYTEDMDDFDYGWDYPNTDRAGCPADWTGICPYSDCKVCPYGR